MFILQCMLFAKLSKIIVNYTSFKVRIKFSHIYCLICWNVLGGIIILFIYISLGFLPLGNNDSNISLCFCLVTWVILLNSNWSIIKPDYLILTVKKFNRYDDMMSFLVFDLNYLNKLKSNNKYELEQTLLLCLYAHFITGHVSTQVTIPLSSRGGTLRPPLQTAPSTVPPTWLTVVSSEGFSKHQLQ